MSDLAAFLNALRGDFGWGGVLALAIVVIVGLLAWNWLKNDSHANTAKVNRSGNSQSTGGSAIATNTINQTFVGYRPVDDTRPKPRIVVSQLKQFQLFEHEIAFFVVGGRAPQQPKPPTPRFYICQVWFKNEPED